MKTCPNCGKYFLTMRRFHDFSGLVPKVASLEVDQTDIRKVQVPIKVELFCNGCGYSERT